MHKLVTPTLEPHGHAGDDDMLASDRETLPFPSGGVFGRHTADDAPLEGESPLDMIERLQERVDQLSSLIDDTFDQEIERIGSVVAHIGASADDDPWRPSAA